MGVGVISILPVITKITTSSTTSLKNYLTSTATTIAGTITPFRETFKSVILDEEGRDYRQFWGDFKGAIDAAVGNIRSIKEKVRNSEGGAERERGRSGARS